MASASETFSPLTGVAFAPEGRYVAAVGADAVVRIWDVETKSEVRGLRGHTDWVTAVAFSPDGRSIASVGVEKDKTLRIFELPTLDVSATGGHALAVNAVAVSPDGKTVATASTDQTIKLWDIASGKPVGTLVGDSDIPFALAFLNNGELVMGGKLEGNVRRSRRRRDARRRRAVHAGLSSRTEPRTRVQSQQRRAVERVRLPAAIAKAISIIQTVKGTITATARATTTATGKATIPATATARATIPATATARATIPATVTTAAIGTAAIRTKTTGTPT